jgi:asparagine synthetase B (glutamine-hydrolysing)
MLDSQGGHQDRPVGAGDLAKALLFRGPQALLDFQGEFFLLVLDESKARLFAATDRFGVRTTYWHVDNGRLCICSELGLAVRLGLMPRKLDKAFVAALLRFNKCRLVDKTIFSGISVVPPGTVQQYDLQSINEPQNDSYYRHQFTEEFQTEEAWIEAIIPVLRRAVCNSLDTDSGPTALALSGGLDSRMLLGATDEKQRKRLWLLSCGLSESDEVKLAASTASRVGGNYKNVNLGPSDYLELAGISIRRNEEFDIFVQGGQSAFHRAAAAEATALMTGWDIDVPLRGTYLDSVTIALASHSEVKRIIDMKWRLFSRIELSELLQESFYREFGDAPEDWLTDTLSLLEQSTPLRLYLQFIYQCEKRRLLMLRNRMIRFELESATPFYNTKLQMLLAGIPESLKVQNRLFARLLVRLAPELSDIPYQRTMLPASVPVEYWSQAAKLEDQREALLREIFINTGIRIPYTRYYSNFDEWLTSNKLWQNFTDELLSSDRTLLTQDVVKASAVKALLAEHKTGPCAQRAKLIYLLSLELYLREYFK